MKKLLLLVSAVALLVGCNSTPDNLVKVTGTILNPDSSELVFFVDRDRDTVLIAEDGSFVFEKESEKPVAINVMYGRKRASIWAAPGKSLDISVDALDWDNSIGFSGDLQSVNEYILEKGLIQMGWGRNYMANFMMEPNDFLKVRDSVQTVFLDLFEEFKGNGMDRDYCDREEIALRYTHFGDLNNYPAAHKYYAKLDEFEAPADWYSFTDNMDLNDPLLVEVSEAMYFLSTWINTEAIKTANLGDDAWGTPELLSAKLAFIDSKFTVPAMVEKFKFDMLSEHLDSGPPTGAEDAIEAYLAASGSEENKGVITEKRDAWAAIEAGQPAPTWTLPDIEGNTFSLADFKGQYVYIDFWATWCGPCLAEIPHYKELVSEYADRNVKFISISVDRDKAAWEKMVTEEQFPWMQLHDGVNMNDDYLVRFIPTFVFVDRDGVIVNPRAPRPSTDELRTLLDAQTEL